MHRELPRFVSVRLCVVCGSVQSRNGERSNRKCKCGGIIVSVHRIERTVLVTSELQREEKQLTNGSRG